MLLSAPLATLPCSQLLLATLATLLSATPAALATLLYATPNYSIATLATLPTLLLATLATLATLLLATLATLAGVQPAAEGEPRPETRYSTLIYFELL